MGKLERPPLVIGRGVLDLGAPEQEFWPSPENAHVRGGRPRGHMEGLEEKGGDELRSVVVDLVAGGQMALGALPPALSTAPMVTPKLGAVVVGGNGMVRGVGRPR